MSKTCKYIWLGLFLIYTSGIVFALVVGDFRIPTLVVWGVIAVISFLVSLGYWKKGECFWQNRNS